MVTNSWMEVLSPTAAYFPNSNWLIDQRTNRSWTQQENKAFEDALAFFEEDSPDRWKKVAEMIPGKTEGDIISHYRDLVEDVNHIEAGLIPFPGYSSSFLLDWESSQGYEGLKQAYCSGGKRSGARMADHERKKGVPWTEEEHRLFLLGLKKYGKGDWRNISRNFVVSRTPTQVASHAQKYFIRLNSGSSKDKRRSSIHDITTVNLPVPDKDNRPPSPSQPSGQSTSLVAPPTISEQLQVDSKQHSEFIPSVHANPFMQPPYGRDPYRMKSQAQHLHRGALRNSIVGHHGLLFQMQTIQPQPSWLGS